jgi:hypothetical protein
MIAARHVQRVDRPPVLRSGLVRHQGRDDPAQDALRVTRLLGDEDGPTHDGAHPAEARSLWASDSLTVITILNARRAGNRGVGNRKAISPSVV